MKLSRSESYRSYIIELRLLEYCCLSKHIPHSNIRIFECTCSRNVGIERLRVFPLDEMSVTTFQDSDYMHTTNKESIEMLQRGK